MHAILGASERVHRTIPPTWCGAVPDAKGHVADRWGRMLLRWWTSIGCQRKPRNDDHQSRTKRGSSRWSSFPARALRPIPTYLKIRDDRLSSHLPLYLSRLAWGWSWKGTRSKRPVWAWRRRAHKQWASRRFDEAAFARDAGPVDVTRAADLLLRNAKASSTTLARSVLAPRIGVRAAGGRRAHRSRSPTRKSA